MRPRRILAFLFNSRTVMVVLILVLALSVSLVFHWTQIVKTHADTLTENKKTQHNLADLTLKTNGLKYELERMKPPSETTMRLNRLIEANSEIAAVFLYHIASGRCQTVDKLYPSLHSFAQAYALDESILSAAISNADHDRAFFIIDGVKPPDRQFTPLVMGFTQRVTLDDTQSIGVYLLGKKAIEHKLLPESLLQYGCATLTDDAGNILMHYVSDYMKANPQESQFELAQGKSGLLTLRSSLASGYVQMQIRQLRINLIALIIGGLLTILFLSTLLWRSRLKPLRNLIHDWADGSDVKHMDGTDEYSIIGNIINHVNFSSSQMEDYKTIARAAGIERLIGAAPLTDRHYAQIARQVGVIPDRFVVGYGAVLAGQANGRVAVLALKAQLEKTFSAKAIFHMLEDDSFVLVLPCDQDGQISPWASNALEEIDRQYRSRLYIALSDPCSDIKQVNSAYEQARLHYLRFSMRDGGYDMDIEEKGSVNDLLKLYRCLINGEQEQSLKLVSQLFRQGMLDKSGIEQRYYTLSTFLAMAAKTVGANDIALLKAYDPTIAPEVALKWLTTYAKGICNYYHAQKEKGEDTQRKPMLAYVHTNFTNPDLYASVLAEKFGFSEKYVYVMFKEQTGQSPASYIQQLRLEYAVRLVVDTNLPIQQISEKVGFVNIGTYNKAFKRAYGISSGQYREMARSGALTMAQMEPDDSEQDT